MRTIDAPCGNDHCTRPANVYARALGRYVCNACYLRWRRSGTFDYQRVPPAELIPALRTRPLVRDESWMQQGRCRGTGTDQWFPDQGRTNRALRATCAGCPVRVPCLDYALTWNERFGVWGGHAERERRQLVREGVSAEQAIAEFDERMVTAGPGAARVILVHEAGRPVSAANYGRGCRCADCVAAAQEYDQRRKARRVEMSA